MKNFSLHALTVGAGLLLSACQSTPNPHNPDLPADFTSGPGWVDLTLDDFVNVNGNDDTWRQEGNIIICSGKPNGGARTLKKYRNFELTVQWKHHEHAGNSGLFLWCPDQAFTDLPPGTLPRTGIEIQVLDLGYEENWEKSKGSPSNWFTSHGDIFPVGASSMTASAPQIEYTKADGTAYTVGKPTSSRSFPNPRVTNPAGQWNTYAVRAVDGVVDLWVNGVKVNQGLDCKPSYGYFALEAEGALIEFKDLRIREL